MTRSSRSAPRVVGARELKTRLGKYLRVVRGGATITITERGIPVARLEPLSPHATGIDAVLDELDSLGIVSKGNGESLGAGKTVTVGGESIERTIARDRDDRA